MTFFVEQDLSRHSPTQVLFDTFQVVPWLGRIQLHQSWQEKKPNPNQNLKWIHISKKETNEIAHFSQLKWDFTSTPGKLQDDSKYLTVVFHMDSQPQTPSVGQRQDERPWQRSGDHGCAELGPLSSACNWSRPGQGLVPLNGSKGLVGLGWVGGLIDWLVVGLSKSTFSCWNRFLFFTFFWFGARKSWQVAKTKKRYGPLHSMVLGKSSKIAAFEGPCVEISRISVLQDWRPKVWLIHIWSRLNFATDSFGKFYQMRFCLSPSLGSN